MDEISEKVSQILDRLDLPPDVRAFADKQPEITLLLVKSNLQKWPAKKLLKRLKKTDWYADRKRIREEWDEEGRKAFQALGE